MQKVTVLIVDMMCDVFVDFCYLVLLKKQYFCVILPTDLYISLLRFARL